MLIIFFIILSFKKIVKDNFKLIKAAYIICINFFVISI